MGHWYENTLVSCLCVRRNRNLGTAALKGIQIREKCDTCRFAGVVVLVSVGPSALKIPCPRCPTVSWKCLSKTQGVCRGPKVSGAGSVRAWEPD